MSDLIKSHLHGIHVFSNAEMIAIGKYIVPAHYSEVHEEHFVIRNKIGIIDNSHLGVFHITGFGAKEYLQKITVNNLDFLDGGITIQYSAICLETGGVIDDIFVYKLGENYYQLLVNAENINNVEGWLRKNVSTGVVISNKSDDVGLIALQGPQAFEFVESLFTSEVKDMEYFTSRNVRWHGRELLLARVGYVGEDGVEFFIEDQSMIVDFWKFLMEEGRDYHIKPVGVQTINQSLRVEVGFARFGNEMTKDTNLYEAGLDFIVDLEKDINFIAKNKYHEIDKKGVNKKIMGLEFMGKVNLKKGSIIFKNTDKVGYITTNIIHPTRNKSIALAYIAKRFAVVNTPVFVKLDEEVFHATLTDRRFI